MCPLVCLVAWPGVVLGFGVVGRLQLLQPLGLGLVQVWVGYV